MWNFFQHLFDESTLSPHGLCLLWRPELIWLNITSDGIIALAYFSIPFALAVFASKRPDVQYSLGVLVVCRVHSGVRPDARYVDLDALGSRLRA